MHLKPAAMKVKAILERKPFGSKEITQNMNIQDRDTAYALQHILKQYSIFETTQNVLIDPKGPENIICTMMKHGQMI